MNSIKYLGKSIRHLNSLETILGTPLDKIVGISYNSDKYYKKGSIPKRDGRLRQIVKPRQELRDIQSQINKQIFSEITWPQYIQGGVTGRSYISNASLHTDKFWVCTCDIVDFFPSITVKTVSRIFIRLFNFSKPVSDRLAGLVTYQSKLPQGAATSPVIANLVLHQIEPLIFEHFARNGFQYSRYVDDIVFSTSNRLSSEDIGREFSFLISKLQSSDFRVHRGKTKAQKRGFVQEVHGLDVSGKYPRRFSRDRKRISVKINGLIRSFETEKYTSKYYSDWMSLYGRVAELAALKDPDSMRLKSLLLKHSPRLHNSKVEILRNQVISLRKHSLKVNRYSTEYRKLYEDVELQFRPYLQAYQPQIKGILHRLKELKPIQDFTLISSTSSI